MARFEVTTMLADGIRMSRIQNNIASKDLAAYLDRSPAYISKLEKGEIKTIEDAELTSILNYILPNQETLQEKVETLVDILLPRYSQNDLSGQLWFINYAWVLCKLPVPEGLAEKIRQWMDAENIHITELTAKINSNAELTEAERNDPNTPINQWRENWVGEERQGHSIKLKVDLSDIKEFLAGKTTEASYLLVYVIVRFMCWMTKFPDTDSLSADERKEIDDATDEFLSAYDFLSIIGKRKRIQKNALHAELNVLFHSDSSDVIAFVQELKSFLDALEPLGPEKSSIGLKALNQTINWDAAFALKVMQMPFAKLEGVSYTNKKQLLTEMEMLIQRYQDMPTPQKSLESYD